MVKAQPFGSNLVAVFTDITELKLIEKQNRKMRGIFFASIAHELRTPLNSIIPLAILLMSRI